MSDGISLNAAAPSAANIDPQGGVQSQMAVKVQKMANEQTQLAGQLIESATHNGVGRQLDTSG